MSKFYKANAYGKINLYLDVLNRMENGYHNVESIMQSVSLCDEVRLELDNINTEENIIEIRTNSSNIPIDKSNLVYRCADKLLNATKTKGKKCIFTIEKQIPIAAGMAGGSSDGATAMKLLNQALSYPLNDTELKKLGATIGADIPFCISGGTCVCRGIGDEITPLKPLKNVYLVCAIDNSSVSTPVAFSMLDEKYGINPPAHGKLSDMKESIEHSDIAGISSLLYNKFESVIIPQNENVQKIKDIMMSCGALGALMSGSGPSVFGLFLDECTQNNALCVLKNCSINAFLCKTV